MAESPHALAPAIAAVHTQGWVVLIARVDGVVHVAPIHAEALVQLPAGGARPVPGAVTSAHAATECARVYVCVRQHWVGVGGLPVCMSA